MKSKLKVGRVTQVPMLPVVLRNSNRMMNDGITPTVGLIQQASNIGQFTGPVAAGLFVSHFGWPAIPLLLIPVALAGLAAVLVLRPRLNA